MLQADGLLVWCRFCGCWSSQLGKATGLHGTCLRPKVLTANWRYQRLLRGVHPLDGDQILPQPSWFLGPSPSKVGGPALPPSMQSQTFEPLPEVRAGASEATLAEEIASLASSLVGVACLEPWFKKKRPQNQEEDDWDEG